jgi:hypothetical protein
MIAEVVVLTTEWGIPIVGGIIVMVAARFVSRLVRGS